MIKPSSGKATPFFEVRRPKSDEGARVKRTVVIDVVGLSGDLVGEATPNLSKLKAAGSARPLETILPAVTCSVQSTFTTGKLPHEHGCVANGWYFRDLAEVWLWRQSNHLVTGEKIWDAAKKREFGRTVLLAMKTLGPNGAEDAHMIALGDAIRALKKAGLEPDAHRLGFEALFAGWPRQIVN